MADSVINNFDKGIHQDSAYILQPDGTFRNMKNGMLISYDGNHYTVEMAKGNKVLLTLTPVLGATTTPMPIGFVSFIDKLIVFSTDNESTGGYGEIGVVTFTKIGDDFTGTYIPYYNHVDLNFTKTHKIEGFSFRENDNIERVYWTDNYNEPRVLDIANPIFTTYLGTSGLVVGSSYMVLTGGIVYDGVNYGPGFTAGNIFTATISGGTTYTILSAPLVIEYYPISLLDWTPSRNLGNISFVEYGSGNKNCGNHIYFYRLSSSTDGYKTSWSYASNPILVGMSNETAYLTGNPYRDFVGNGTTTTIKNSNKSVKVKITNIDTDFDTIELCCAEFDQKDEIPYSITIVNKEAITSSEMTIEDIGGINLGTVTISDLTLFPASVLNCKTISTNKNYNIIANITEREEFDLDLSTVTIGQSQYPLYVHGDITLCENGDVYEDVSPLLTSNPLPNSVAPYTRWLVTVGNGTTDTVTYNTVVYNEGDVITATYTSILHPNADTIYFTGSGAVRPCTTRNKYTITNPLSPNVGERVEDPIQLKTGFWDYKDPAVAAHNKGYWSDEKYRFGLLFYDKKGNPFYVKYLGDYTFGTINAKGGLMIQANLGSEIVNYLNPSCATISGLELPESVMNEISGFSIVRAERDATIITQGLLMQTVINSATNFIYPLSVVRTEYSVYPPVYTPLGDLCSCVCPDWLVGYFQGTTFTTVGQKVKEASWLDDAYGGLMRPYNADCHVITSKLFSNGGVDSASPRTMILQSIKGDAYHEFPEEVGTSDLLGDGRDFYNNLLKTDTLAVQTGVDYSCTTGATWTGGDIITVGSKKILVLPEHFNHFGPTGQYNGSGTERFISKKILVNFLTGRDSSAQYGGNSSQAIANTLYMSTGHFQPIDSTVKANTIVGSYASGPYIGQNKYRFDNIEIFGGDCFTNMIDHGWGLWDQTYEAANNAMSYSIWFPCEGNVNYGLRRGLKVSNRDMFPSGLMAWNSPLTPSTQLESYSYNQGYSSDGTFIKYPALPVNYTFTGKFEYRMRWAGLKYPGELINSFRTFRTADYRDVDGQRGQINNLKARDSKLFYWQDHSVGYTPILERQLVGGSALGDATALGVTGVIDRYDDIDTYFGNQHQHGLTETEYGYAWFDMRRRAFMVMGIGSKPEEMSMVKGLQVYFNNEFNEGDLSTGNNIYNTNNLSIPEEPLMGYGIVGVYDPRFKMTYLTFKYKKYDLISKEDDTTSTVNRDFTIGYNHILNAFVSFYDFCPAIWHNHNDLVLSANNPKATVTYDSHTPDFTEYKVGDTVAINGVEYLCIKNVTIVTWPGTLTGTKTNPLASGSQYWVAINKENEIYLQTFGTDLCKFYGKVWDHSMEIVVNFKTDMAVTPQNIQFKSVGPNWTDLIATTEDQTSQDLNISTTNRNYRWIDKSWFSNLPIDRVNGRLTDYYVKLNFVYKNYVTNPTVAKNVQKVSQWLKTFFVNKR